METDEITGWRPEIKTHWMWAYLLFRLERNTKTRREIGRCVPPHVFSFWLSALVTLCQPRIIPSLSISTYLQGVFSLFPHPFRAAALGTLPIMHHSSGAQLTQLASRAAINHRMKNVWGEKNKGRKLPRAGMEKSQHRISFGMQHTLFFASAERQTHETARQLFTRAAR